MESTVAWICLQAMASNEVSLDWSEDINLMQLEVLLEEFQSVEVVLADNEV